LPTRHTVDAIVNDDGCYTDIAPGGMDEMIAANRHRIPISHDGDHFHFWSGDFQPGSERQRTPMRGVDGVEIHVDWHTSGAANPRNQGYFIFFHSNSINCPNQSPHHDAYATTGAPHVGELLGWS
jgi:hypothetical protein